MGKNLKNCFSAMEKLAKLGKLHGTFSLYPEEISVVRKAGFSVTVPKNYRDDKRNKKNLWEVKISWDKSTCGIAGRLNKIVTRYRHRCNAKSRNNRVKVMKASVTADEYHEAFFFVDEEEMFVDDDDVENN